jgi:hypothetical protein
MAERKLSVIDGEFRQVSPSASLADVAGPDVQSVSTSDGRIINRSDFARYPVPDGFERNLSQQVKG